MPMLTIHEDYYLTTTDQRRQEIHSMMRELAYDSGINWQDEYRWALMTPQNYFIAQLKYNHLLTSFRIQ